MGAKYYFKKNDDRPFIVLTETKQNYFKKKINSVRNWELSADHRQILPRPANERTKPPLRLSEALPTSGRLRLYL